MKRAIALTAAFAIAAPGCEFAVKHPAITTGLASGIIGFGGCELDAQRAGPCALAGGIVGVGLGAIAAIVLWAVGDRNTDPDAAAIPDPSTGAIGDEPVRVRVKAKHDLPPDPTVVTPPPPPTTNSPPTDSPTPTPTPRPSPSPDPTPTPTPTP